MDWERQGDLFDPDWTGPEGLFDAQMPLPFPTLERQVPFQAIIKRDGRQEPFNKHKIARAIFKAAQSAGGQDYDLAEHLASAVTIYLTKRLGAQAPTVDQVHDAVERVLIHMAHGRTALAYARYRDRRARIRRLREGDMRALLSELAEAKHEQEALRGHRDALLVRTSADTLSAWDREKIIEALVRETGLERPAALMIAVEVEQQIEKARITTLTTALVRELVDARLVEHGLDAYRTRHQRLGVPLYDSERIIRGATADTAGQSPAATDRTLAQMVKKEYALAQVFSTPVTEAHLRGEIHLHHIEQVDRLFSATHSPEYLVRYGVSLTGARDFSGPAKHADTLLAQLLRATEVYQELFTEPPQWDALNVFLAPFLQGWGAEQIERFVRMLVYEFAYRALTRGAPGAGVRLCWRVPAWLRGVEAIGPDGAPSGKAYGAYESTAQQIAWALLDVLAENGEAVLAPVPWIEVGTDFGLWPGAEGFLNHAARAARHAHYVFGRNDGSPRAPWRPANVALQQVTLNLPRAAYMSGKEAALYDELDRLVALAAMAHQEKHDFIVGLLDETGQRPLSLLASTRDGRPYVDLSEAVCLVAVDGLNECLHALLRSEMHTSEEAAEAAERILERLREACRRHGERTGLRLAPAQNNDAAVSARFAALDLQAFPKTAAATLKLESEGDEPRYSTGVRAVRGSGLSPMETVRLEGRFHERLAYGMLTETALPIADASESTISDFLIKTLRQTSNEHLTFR